MKKTTIFLIFLAFTIHAMSQNDIAKPDSLTAEDKLFKGDYEISDDHAVYPVFSFSKFTSSKKRYRVHGSGLFAGFSNLSTRTLSEIGTVKDAELKLSSFEIGLTLFGVGVQLHKKYGWLFFAGLGFKVQQYNADRNYAFVKQDYRTIQVQPENGIFYSKSRLVQWYLHMPIMFEYQKKLPKRSNFFVQAGVELGLKLSSKSSVMYRDERDKRIRQTMGRGMNVNPLTADAKVELGFNNLALYGRYGLIELFRKGRGPEVIPVAAGVIWHF
ncbi:MAG: PorT family protein [Lentimicrobiaceae bacterium]|nr:PorT family protein [Lentimicrobiaceae bacterium]